MECHVFFQSIYLKRHQDIYFGSNGRPPEEDCVLPFLESISQHRMFTEFMKQSTVVPTKGDSDVIFCSNINVYTPLELTRIDISFVQDRINTQVIYRF